MTAEFTSDKEAIEALRRTRHTIEPSPADLQAAEELLGPNFNPPLSSSERVDLIIEYESGEGSQRNMLRLFSDLIASGAVWSLQGHYGRAAQGLIEVGAIARDGTILYPLDLA